MARDLQTQNNFAAGEIDPKAIDRPDSPVIKRAVRRMRNMVITPLGQMRRRPGTRYLLDLTGLTGATPANARLETYVFSATQYYVLIFEVGRIGIYSINGTLIQAFTTSPATKITAARLWEFHMTYRGDSIIVTHVDFWPIEIKRTSATTFTCADFPFYKAASLDAWQSTSADPSYRRGPFYYAYPPRGKDGAGVSLSLSAATGSITVTASVAYFDPLHVGAIFGADGAQGGTGYQYLRNYNEGFIVTAYTSPTVVTATVLGTSSLGLSQAASNNGGSDWAELMWNDLRGYPRCAIFHEQRLFFAGNKASPNAIWGSCSASLGVNALGDGAYYHVGWMAPLSGGVPTEIDAMLYFLADDEVLDIRRLFSYRNLHIFTATSEFIVPNSLTDTAITPFNFRARKQTSYGVADGVRPVVYDDAVVFVQRTEQVVREVVYNDLQKAYGAQSLSNLAPHLLTGPKQASLWKGSTTSPEALLLMAQDDGSIAVMQGNRGNDTLGWHAWTTNGRFLGVAAIFDLLFMLVARRVNGVERVYLERMDETSILDATMAWTSLQPTDRVTGAGHLAGLTGAAVVGDQWVAVGAVSASGEIDLPLKLDAATIGLDVTTEIELLPPSPPARNGITLGQPKRVARVSVGVEDCLTILINGQDKGPRKRRRAYQPADLVPAYDGQIRAAARGVATRLSTTLSQDRPSPLVVLSVSRDVVF